METPIQKRVLQVLIDLADENGEVHQSSPEIATQAKASKITILRVLHELADLGEISILNQQRVKGHYHINNLPDGEKTRFDLLRMEIIEIIRALPLPVRVSVIFQMLIRYTSRSGNIFPSIKILMKDTGYSKVTIQETMRWLHQAKLITPDEDYINPNDQSQTAYKVPGWNAKARSIQIDETQIEQINVLYRQRNQTH
jgi:DNA-binding transcriptional regulator YhcF (GntR family)